MSSVNRRFGRFGGGSLQNRQKCGVPCVAVVVAICWCLFIASKIPDSIFLDIIRKKNLSIRAITVKGAASVNNTTEIVGAATLANSLKLKFDEKQIHGPSSAFVSPIVAVEHNNIHVVFSTDCSFYQDWQTLVVFHSAMAVGQKGEITRIASGCDEAKKNILLELYLKLFPRYHVHFTPDFKVDKKTKKKYEFYNKPYGVEHWLSNTQILNFTVIAIIDPDMIFVRSLTVNLKEDNMILMDGKEEVPSIIEKGHPVSQLYGLGAPWAGSTSKNFNRTNVCGENSPCLKVTSSFGQKHYSVGPPYMVEKSDLIKLTKSWVAFVPRVHERYPELLAEMFAYSMAAAHEDLPHFQLLNYMVSNTFADEEGWQWIDALGDDVCIPPVISKEDSVINGGVNRSRYYPQRGMPTFVHYCQFFRIGELGFHKRRLKESILNCDFPLLVDPPLDIGKTHYKNRDGEIVKLSPKQARRNAFALCVIHRSINAMLEYYKGKMCPLGAAINPAKTLNVVHWPK
mmetsp:Transcript_26744/g.25617  ORF Transcript_26744/g.25617 Transcript_26744/m.25617 type:complete len:512 (-) Transcript_26744:103-1638(-)